MCHSNEGQDRERGEPTFRSLKDVSETPREMGTHKRRPESLPRLHYFCWNLSGHVRSFYLQDLVFVVLVNRSQLDEGTLAFLWSCFSRDVQHNP